MAGSGELKLLGVWSSPYAIRVRVVLNLKSLPYEYVEENLGDKSDLLLASNPVHKSVPVLLHAGRRERVAGHRAVHRRGLAGARRGRSVMPSDPYERACSGPPTSTTRSGRRGCDPVREQDGGGEGGGGGEAWRRGDRRGRVRGVLQGEAVLRATAWVRRRRRARRLPRVVHGDRQADRRRLIDPARTSSLAAWEERSTHRLQCVDVPMTADKLLVQQTSTDCFRHGDAESKYAVRVLYNNKEKCCTIEFPCSSA
nr:unnamed protein product [Oryza sativa Japonica Group]prf//1908434C chilling tolerance-related protein:ISOTYPE=pBC591 [Oryza sativa]